MARARAADRAGRFALGALAVVVAALLVSWAYAAFWPRRGEPVAGEKRRIVRVQVWNGSGEGGVGARVATALRAGGFHVTEVRNADRSDYFATLVVARRDDPEAARAVAHYLGDLPVVRQAWSEDLADVTVVIGSDRSRLRLD